MTTTDGTGRVVRDQRQTHIELLWARGEGLLLKRSENERFPCDGKTEMFFPDRVSNRQAANRQTSEAKRLCDRCHRKTECFTQADTRKERYGIWGGEDFYYRYGIGLARNRRVERERRTQTA